MENPSDYEHPTYLTYPLINIIDGINITKCTFTSIYSTKSLMPTKKLYLNSSIFTDIQRSSGNGAVSEITGDILDVFECTFDTCEALNGNGGAIYASVDKYFNFTSKVDINKFYGCSARKGGSGEDLAGRGGALYFKFGRYMKEYLLKEIVFGAGIKKNAADYGSNLFIESESVEVFFKDSLIPFISDTSFEHVDYEFCLNNKTADVYSFYDLLNSNYTVGPSQLYMGGSGSSDSNDCESVKTSCNSLNVSFSKVKVGRKNLYIIGECYFSFSDSFNKGSYYLKNYSTDSVFRTGQLSVDVVVETTFEGIKFSLTDTTSNYSDTFLFSSSSPKFSLKNVIFECISKEKCYTCKALIRCPTGGLFIDGCKFSRINSTSSSSGYYSCIYFLGSTLCITDTTFEDVIHKMDGGALTIVLKKNSNITIMGVNKQTEFKRCVASKGGAISMQTVDLPSNILFSNILFGTGLNVNVADKGRDMFFSCKLMSNILNLNNFPILDVDDTVDGFLGSLESTGTEEFNLVTLVKSYNGSVTYYVGDSGDDQDRTSNCSEIEHPCKTLSYCLYKKYYYEKTVEIIEKTTCSSTIYLNYVNYHILGHSQGVVVFPFMGCSFRIQVDTKMENFDFAFLTEFSTYMSESLVSLSDCEVSFSNIKFIQNDLDATLTDVLVSVLTGGCLLFTNCTLDTLSFNSENASPIKGTPDKLLLNNSRFCSCSIPDGSGGAVHLTLSETSVVYIGAEGTNTSFSKCSAKRGGAIYLSYETIPDSFVINNIDFGSEGNNTASEAGNNIFVSSMNLGIVVTKEIFPFLVNKEEDNMYQGMSTTEDKNIYSLIQIVNNLTNTSTLSFVGDGGNDSNNCKSTENMCNSISHTIEGITIGHANITIVDKLSTYEELTLQRTTYLFKGNKDNTTINVYSKLHFMLYVDTSFVSLFFNLSDILLNNFFSVYSGTLSLTSSSFFSSQLSVLFYSLINIEEEGGAIITSSSFNNIYLHGRNGAAIKGELTNGRQLIINDSSFVGCEGVGSNGGCISITSQNLAVIYINGTDFNKCCVHDGNGGGLFAEIKDGGCLTIKGDSKPSSFKSCSAIKESNENGRGGAMFLQFSDKPGIVIVSNIIFGSEEGKDKNIADEGYNMFVKANDLNLIITIETFPVLYTEELTILEAIGEEKNESGGYNTYPLYYVTHNKPENAYVNYNTNNNKKYCGTKDYPCKEFEDVFVKYNGLNKSIILCSEYSINIEYVMNDTCYNISETNGEYVVNTGSECSFIMSVYSSFTNISFSLSSSLSKNFMSISLNTLTLTSVNIYAHEGVSTLALPLIFVSSQGSALLSLCSICNISSSNLNGTAIFANLSSSSPSLSSSSSLLSSSLSSSSSSSPSSSSSSNPSLILKGSTFKNCEAVNGNGGAVYVYITKDTSISIEKEGSSKTAFLSCSAREGNNRDNNNNSNNNNKDNEEGFVGRGGDIYLRIGSNPGSIYLSNIEMGKGDEKNEAVEGYDIFVEAINLLDLITTDNFPFLVNMNKDYDGAIGIEEGQTERINLADYLRAKVKKRNYTIVISVCVVIFVVIIIISIIICCLIKRRRSNNFVQMSDDNKYTDAINNNRSKEMYGDYRDNSINSYYGSGDYHQQ